MSIAQKPTHCLTLPSLSEVHDLFDTKTKEFFSTFYGGINPDLIDGYDPGFQMYMGFALYLDGRFNEYSAGETENKLCLTAVVMRTDPDGGLVANLGRTKMDDMGIRFEAYVPPNFDLRKFRQELPEIINLPMLDRPDILASWSDLMITKMTPERYSIASFLPLAPRHNKVGGLYEL